MVVDFLFSYWPLSFLSFCGKLLSFCPSLYLPTHLSGVTVRDTHVRVPSFPSYQRAEKWQRDQLSLLPRRANGRIFKAIFPVGNSLRPSQAFEELRGHLLKLYLCHRVLSPHRWQTPVMLLQWHLPWTSLLQECPSPPLGPSAPSVYTEGRRCCQVREGRRLPEVVKSCHESQILPSQLHPEISEMPFTWLRKSVIAVLSKFMFPEWVCY